MQRVYGGARAGVAAELEDRHQVVLKDPILNLEAEVAGLDVAATPVGPTFAVHWLSVQGSQPTIIENPAPSGE